VNGVHGACQGVAHSILLHALPPGLQRVGAYQPHRPSCPGEEGNSSTLKPISLPTNTKPSTSMPEPYTSEPRPQGMASRPVCTCPWQVLRWATGSVEISPPVAQRPVGRPLHGGWGSCSALHTSTRQSTPSPPSPSPSTAASPLCRSSRARSSVPNITDWAVLYFMALFLSIFLTAILEIRVRWRGRSCLLLSSSRAWPGGVG